MARTKEEKALIEALPDDERIKNEYKRLLKIYTRAGAEDKLKLARKLIARAAFMAITLDDLEREISKEGVTEEYQNGANQKGIKKSAKAEVYNTTMKSYTAVMKQLNDMLPVETEEKEPEKDEFEIFG